MGGHKPGDKIAENELPERSPASKTPHNPSPELSRGPSALIFDDGSRRGHPEAPGGPKRRKRRFEHFLFVAWFVSPRYCPYGGMGSPLWRRCRPAGTGRRRSARFFGGAVSARDPGCLLPELSFCIV